MPESSCAHTYERNASHPLAMESPLSPNIFFESVKVAGNGCLELGRTMSVESLNTLLSKLPEISIPPTLHNPLPLQCLAANALPDGVKAEIDGVIAQYSASDCPVSSECSKSPCAMSESIDSIAEDESSILDKDVDNLTAALHKALGIEELASPSCCSKSVSPVTKVIIQRDVEWETHSGFGLKLCGGVRCNNCSSLHAVVTELSPNFYRTEEIFEGVCVVSWDGQSLDGCTYEEVQRVVSSVEPSVTEIEVSVKKCGDTVLIGHSGFDWLPSFATVRLNKRRNALFERDNDHKSTISEDSSESVTLPPNSPSHSHTRSREHLDLPMLTDPIPSTRQRSVSRSPSPCDPIKKLLPITIPKSDETTQALLASFEAGPKSPNSLDSIMNMLPNGMIQLSLEYNKDFEELSVYLLQVKGQSSKELSDASDVFINTYLVPDLRDQGVRSIVSAGARKYSGEYHNTSYMLAPDEISVVALRVILWDAHKTRNVSFRGEVLLGLSDYQIVNLAGEPTWYTLCPEDPNLSNLPPPVHFKHRSSVESLLHRLKQKAHSLASVKPLKASTSLTNELKSSSMLSLPGSMEKRSMTLMRKKERKDTRKTHSGSFSPQLVDPVFPTEPVGKSCLKEPCRQQKLSSILNVLRESKEDLLEAVKDIDTNNMLQRGQTYPVLESTNGEGLGSKYANLGPFHTVNRRHRKKSTPTGTKRRSFPGKVKENGVLNQQFLEELEKMMSQENFGLQSTPVKVKEEGQAHYKLVDGRQSDDEPSQSPNQCSEETSQHRKSNDCLRYPAEVSLHKITVEDVDKVSEAKKKTCTLPVERTSYSRPTSLILSCDDLDLRPPKPPKTHRSKSVDDLEKLGSDEELFIVHTTHQTVSTEPADYQYSKALGSVDQLDSVGPLVETGEGLSSLDFGNRTKHFASSDCLDIDGSVDELDGLRQSSPEEEIEHKKMTKSKWKSLEDLLGNKGKKDKEKTWKPHKTSTESSNSSIWRTNSETSTNVSAGNVKLEFQFNDLNRAHPVLLVKLTDVALTSRKLLSSDLLMKCYINHMSTGVCILKDRTTISMKNYSPSVPLGILQFGTDIANLSVQVLLCVGSKMFSRKVIGQVSVDLAALDLSGGKSFSQWFLLSKPTQTPH